MEAGNYVEVHPTFLYESICTFAIFIILQIKTKNRKFKGQITELYLILYSFARMLIETLRADSLMLGPIRISQLLSLAILTICLVIYIKKTRITKDYNVMEKLYYLTEIYIIKE